ncbi:YqaA family protein [Fluviicola taffensis]|uniref:SNARE associated Golgi protein-related protein n=1 Tax=Fluviicola taffensis (strain DSM 16823 / NCIMB 13979 / RW262) TaxID=755732 RepID=F2IFY5_FLUTR|nr:YqaA family protein [Fluviicola taffensis]AEA43606.1 SNARE associated Golgi protein-related protein [Fluviicola taffensis DSM 16823]
MEYWSLVTCFASCFLSSTIIPFPSEASVIYCLSQGQNSLLVLLIATVGNSLGGATNYFIGKFARNRLMKKTAPKAQQFVLKYGVYSALLSWLPIIGDPIMIALGIYETKKIPTFIYMTLGKFLRYLILVILFLYY